MRICSVAATADPAGAADLLRQSCSWMTVAGSKGSRDRALQLILHASDGCTYGATCMHARSAGLAPFQLRSF